MKPRPLDVDFLSIRGNVQMDTIPITREGLEKLKQELINLEKVERPQNIRAIEEARDHGDISENAEYHAAKEKQSFIAGRINELQTVIGTSEVIEVENGPADRVVFGSKVLSVSYTHLTLPTN